MVESLNSLRDKNEEKNSYSACAYLGQIWVTFLGTTQGTSLTQGTRHSCMIFTGMSSYWNRDLQIDQWMLFAWLESQFSRVAAVL